MTYPRGMRRQCGDNRFLEIERQMMTTRRSYTSQISSMRTEQSGLECSQQAIQTNVVRDERWSIYIEYRVCTVYAGSGLVQVCQTKHLQVTLEHYTGQFIIVYFDLDKDIRRRTPSAVALVRCIVRVPPPGLCMTYSVYSGFKNPSQLHLCLPGSIYIHRVH